MKNDVLQKNTFPVNLSGGDHNMLKKALVIIDIQNDITKNYKEIIGNIDII